PGLPSARRHSPSPTAAPEHFRTLSTQKRKPRTSPESYSIHSPAPSASSFASAVRERVERETPRSPVVPGGCAPRSSSLLADSIAITYSIDALRYCDPLQVSSETWLTSRPRTLPSATRA